MQRDAAGGGDIETVEILHHRNGDRGQPRHDAGGQSVTLAAEQEGGARCRAAGFAADEPRTRTKPRSHKGALFSTVLKTCDARFMAGRRPLFARAGVRHAALGCRALFVASWLCASLFSFFFAALRLCGFARNRFAADDEIGRGPRKNAFLHYVAVPACRVAGAFHRRGKNRPGVGLARGGGVAHRATGIILPRRSVNFVNFGILLRGRRVCGAAASGSL